MREDIDECGVLSVSDELVQSLYIQITEEKCWLIEGYVPVR